jgi:hypothetical protein
MKHASPAPQDKCLYSFSCVSIDSSFIDIIFMLVFRASYLAQQTTPVLRGSLSVDKRNQLIFLFVEVGWLALDTYSCDTHNIATATTIFQKATYITLISLSKDSAKTTIQIGLRCSQAENALFNIPGRRGIAWQYGAY